MNAFTERTKKHKHSSGLLRKRMPLEKCQKAEHETRAIKGRHVSRHETLQRSNRGKESKQKSEDRAEVQFILVRLPG